MLERMRPVIRPDNHCVTISVDNRPDVSNRFCRGDTRTGVGNCVASTVPVPDGLYFLAEDCGVLRSDVQNRPIEKFNIDERILLRGDDVIGKHASTRLQCLHGPSACTTVALPSMPWTVPITNLDITILPSSTTR